MLFIQANNTVKLYGYVIDVTLRFMAVCNYNIDREHSLQYKYYILNESFPLCCPYAVHSGK